MKQVELRTLKEGDYFKRKISAKSEYIRAHYNRKSFDGPACFSCYNADDICKEIFLKPTTLVFIDS